MIRPSTLAASLLLLLAAAAQAAGIETKAAPGVDFSSFSTYRWEKAEGPGAPDFDRVLRNAADDELGEKGLRKVDGDQEADLLLRYNAGTVDSLVAGIAVTAGWWGDLIAYPAGESRTTGGLVMILSAAKSGEVVWTGWKVQRGTNVNAPMVMRDSAPKWARQILDKYPR